MKTKLSVIRAGVSSFCGSICAGAVLLMASDAPAQNLFVAVNTGITEITPSGAQSTFASGLLYPAAALAFNSAGDLFVTEYVGSGENGGGTINEFTPDYINGQTPILFASGFQLPFGLAFNSAGDLFMADYYSGNIYEFTPGGVQSTFASEVVAPRGPAFKSAGDLFVANASNGKIYEYTPGYINGQTPITFASGLSSPRALAFNSAGDLFVADVGSGKIYEYTTNGVQSTFASGLDFPFALAFNSAGDLFESDSGSGNIYEFTPGYINGQTPITFASFGFNAPLGLAFQPVLLAIIPSGTNVILTWPTNAIGFNLQSTTNLVSSTFWNTNMPPPVVVNGQNVVTNTISGAQMFYRLSQQQ